MIKEEVLTEKLKYLVTMASKSMFDIFEFHIDFMYENYETKDRISEYNIDIKFDYLGHIEEHPRYMGRDINKVMDQMNNYISEYVITPDGKLSQNYDAYVDGVIWEFNFKFEEEHIFNTSFKVNFPENYG